MLQSGPSSKELLQQNYDIKINKTVIFFAILVPSQFQFHNENI